MCGSWREWDNLVVLDACRYDKFSEFNDIPGELEKVESLATSTPTWLKKNFTEYYDDIVYVSGNAHCSNVEVKGFRGSEHFHHVEDVWDYGHDEELGAVPPEEITQAALELKEEYPDKRFIIHYQQPHEPFIGETRIDIEREDWEDLRDIWNHPEVENAYEDNLELVLAEVKNLLEDLEGKTVITADHGEMFGERLGLWRHPRGIYLKELVDVPWLEVED